jgi:hypothetical protein
VLVSICLSLPAELQRALASVFAGAVNMRIRSFAEALDEEHEKYIRKLDEVAALIGAGHEEAD